MGVLTGVVLDEDPLTKSHRVFHFDQETEVVTLEDRQAVDDIMARNRYLASIAPSIGEQARSGKEFIHVAGIPLNILMDLKKQGVKLSGTPEETKQFRRWLEDNANADWRIARGTI